MIVHFALLIILLLLNLIPEKYVNREKYVLPLSFLFVFIYWAIRYDYGLDYWAYYDIFYGSNEYVKGFGEAWFYYFLHLFSAYYQAIIALSFITAISLFHLVRKYISPKAYWLFFLLLFIVPSLHFNLISALRSSTAAVVLYWGFDLFYIQKKQWVPFIGMVLVATMFHTSAFVFITVPLFYWLSVKLTGRIMFVVLVICNVLSYSLSNVFFSKILGISAFSDYEGYVDRVSTRGLFFILGGLLLLPAWYFICHQFRTGDSKYDRICILAFLYQIIDYLYINFEGRFTTYLYPFFIIVFACVTINRAKWQRLVMLVPYLFYLGYCLFWYYITLYSKLDFEWSSGNMFYYHTIFDAPQLP